MNFIFKYTLLNHFCSQEHKLTHETLSQALQLSGNKVSQSNLEKLITQCQACIRSLIIQSCEQQEFSPLLHIKTFFEGNDFAQSCMEIKPKQLEQVWFQECSKVWSSILRCNSSSQGIKMPLEWHGYSCVTKNNPQQTVLQRGLQPEKQKTVSIKLGEGQSLVVHGKQSLVRLEQSLNQICQLVDQTLLSQEEHVEQ